MTLAALMAELRRAHDLEMRDLRLLAAHAAGVAPDRLTLVAQDEAEPSVEVDLRKFAQMRAAGRPVSKITGARLFWGRSFRVTDDVLDPRPETEVLISQALESGPVGRVLDLGTGSGAIAVTLAADWPDAQITATDISEAALRIAADNSARHDVQDRIRLVQSDWFGAVDGQFDLIVSNPPYIALSEWDGLSREVRGFDPRGALTDDADGLSAYRVICDGAAAHLLPGGRLMVEIGWQQGQDVSRLMQTAGLRDIRVTQDMDGRDRCVTGIFAAV